MVSNHGTRAYHAGTFAGLIINTMSDDSAGWAKGGGWRLADMDTETLGREAVSKAVDGRNPVAIEPGCYPVVLDTYAVDDILEALSMYGMGAQAVQEGRSWMNDIIGDQVMSPSVTIWDDGSATQGWPLPFDAEGVPRRRVDVITAGVVNTPVHNSYTAGKDGVVSTGHQITYPVKDLRFTQSYVDALAGVELVGRESKLILNEVGFATRVPALKLASFNFTGVTV